LRSEKPHVVSDCCKIFVKERIVNIATHRPTSTTDNLCTWGYRRHKKQTAR